MAYSPKYLSTEEIPVQIPDDYEQQEKLDALEIAESSLEGDINNGEKIPQQYVSSLITAALKQKATCELAKGSEHPDDTALGDLEDSGSTKVDYATEAFCDEYDRLVDVILQTETWAESGGDSTEHYIYNTSKPADER